MHRDGRSTLEPLPVRQRSFGIVREIGWHRLRRENLSDFVCDLSTNSVVPVDPISGEPPAPPFSLRG